MKRNNTVTEATVQRVEPAGLIPLAELAVEGLGTVDALARQFGGLVVLDDVGRRCVSRGVARDLIAARAAAEERRRTQRRRRAEEWAKRPRPERGGVPPLPGLTALETMLNSSVEDELQKDAAAAKTAALLRGENVGERFSPRGQ